MFIAACLNAPLGWFFSWRHFLHMKDEALSNDQIKINAFPIAEPSNAQAKTANELIAATITAVQSISELIFSKR